MFQLTAILLFCFVLKDKTVKTTKKYQTPVSNESGYNSDKATSGSELDRNAPMCVEDSGVPSPTVGMLSISPDSPENSFASSEMNIDMCGGGHNSPNDEEITDRPESRLSFVKQDSGGNGKGADLKADFSRLSLLNDEKKMNLGYGACGSCEDEKVGRNK